ncbi:MAG: XdhC/CoxF family protein, partial [Deltaproteobacteria bacterium]|nr:XdhC/CoxF family protein [Deltaproteobacteria bacterium]
LSTTQDNNVTQYDKNRLKQRGSRDIIYGALVTEGFMEDDLRRVHSPIGIAIDAGTPEEIAVSIVAELIKERAKRR